MYQLENMAHADTPTPDTSAIKRNILIAVDGSDHSKTSLNWYVKNGYREGDNAFIAYCVEHLTLPPTAMMAGNPSGLQAIIHDHEAHTKKVFQEIEEYIGKLNIRHVLEKLHGSPGDAIVKAAEKQKVDFIVMGSRGQGTVRRTVMGSVSDYVVHHAHVPVVICKHA